MSKVVITLSDKPNECSIIVNGEQIKDVASIEASVNLDDGPKVSYNIHKMAIIAGQQEATEEMKTINFNIGEE